MAAPPKDTDPVQLSMAAARRVAKATRAFEREPVTTPPPGLGGPTDRAVRYAVVTEWTQEYDPDTKELGLFQAKLQYRDPADRKLKDYEGPIVVDVDTNVTGTLAEGTNVTIVVVDGAFSLFVAQCPTS